MNKMFFFFAAGILIFSCPTANAQYADREGGIKVNTRALERVESHRSPLQLQLIDDRPRLTDHRRPETQPDTLIIYPSPLGTVPGRSIVIGNPASPSGPGESPFRTQNPMVSNTHELSPAGFQSNYRPGPSPFAQGLPKGSSSAGLSNYSETQVSAKLGPQSQAAKPLATQAKPQATMAYPAYATGNASGGQERRVSTGVLAKRILPKP